MRLLALAGDIDALIAQIRLRTPLALLSQQQGWPLNCLSFHDCTRADLAASDVLIVQRGMTRRAWQLQEAMRRRGGAVIYEIDDLLTALPAHISNQAAVQAQQPWLLRCLATADVVSVSTARLGRELGVPDPLCVPNCAWPPSDAALPPPQPGQPVSLLFASMERLATGEIIYPTLRALLGPGVQAVVVGPAAQGFLEAGVAVQARPLMPREAFIAFARSLPNPLAVIPLEDSRFAACKSAVKWFEYAEAGIPTLCSALSPYANVVHNGVTGGLVENSAPAWQAAMRDAIADAAWRQRIAMAARAQVRQQHSLQHMVDAWRQAVETGMQRRAGTVLPPPTLAWRLQQALSGSVEGVLLGLRRFNRARLVRRQHGRR